MQALLAAANVDMHRMRLPEAMARAEGAVAPDPLSAEARLVRSAILRLLGHEAEALADLRSAEHLDPWYAPAYAEHAWQMVCDGNAADSLKIRREEQRVRGTATELYCALALDYRLVGDGVQAEAFLAKSEGAGLHCEAARIVLAADGGDLELARVEYDRVRGGPRFGVATWAIGMVYAAAGGMKVEAIAEAGRFLALNPSCAPFMDLEPFLRGLQSDPEMRRIRAQAVEELERRRALPR